MAIKQTLTKLSLAGLLFFGIGSCNKEQDIQVPQSVPPPLYKMHDKKIIPEIKPKTNLEKRIEEAIEKSKINNSQLIVISKASRRLFFYNSGKLDTVYSVGFGLEVLMDKEKRGDGRTPEGEFIIGLRNPKGWSKYYESLMLNYPLPEDAARGLREGIIDKPEYKKIMLAHKKQKMPDQRTGLGGEICIHGNGSQVNWTEGCVALNDKDIDYIFKKVDIGIPVIITKN